MIKIKEAIVVEGRYDKNTISQVVDALIIETEGFRIFSDRDKCELLKRVAQRRGIIIFTDSDGAGFVIRNYLKGIVNQKYIKNAYIPDIYGKERRKSSPSKEGKLGVEGMDPDVIICALRASGATFCGELSSEEVQQSITKFDLYRLGLSGAAGSSNRRRELLRKLNLPERLTSNSLVEVVNSLYSRDEFEKIVLDDAEGLK